VNKQRKKEPLTPDHWIPLKGEGADFGIDCKVRSVELAWDRDRDTIYITKLIEATNG